MRISGNDMRYNIGSIYKKKNYFNNQTTADTHTNESPSDSASFSEQGKQFSSLMSRVQSLDTTKLEATVSEIKSALKDLDLGQLDIESSSRETLETVYNDVNTTLNALSEEATLEPSSLEIDTLSDEALKDLIYSMKSHSEKLVSSLDNLERMGGNALFRNTSTSSQRLQQNRFTTYNSQMSLSTTSNQSENMDLIQSLVVALEEDNRLDSSNFYTTVTNYMNQNNYDQYSQLFANH